MGNDSKVDVEFVIGTVKEDKESSWNKLGRNTKKYIKSWKEIIKISQT